MNEKSKRRFKAIGVIYNGVISTKDDVMVRVNDQGKVKILNVMNIAASSYTQLSQSDEIDHDDVQEFLQFAIDITDELNVILNKY